MIFFSIIHYKLSNKFESDYAKKNEIKISIIQSPINKSLLAKKTEEKKTKRQIVIVNN